MKKQFAPFLFILAFWMMGDQSFSQTNAVIKATDIDWSVEVSNMIVNTKTPSTVGKWQYEDGLLLEGILRVYKRTDNSKYLNFIRDWAQLHITTDGTIDQPLNSLDNLMPGFMLLHLYKETGIERFKLAANKIRLRFESYPRTSDSCFWHATDLQNELWLDGLYMGMPFLATYGSYFSDQNYAYKEVIRQFTRHFNHLLDNQTNLLLHAYDEDGSEPWALPPLNRSPWVWCRSVGWVAMGLSEVLDIIPSTFPQHNVMVSQYVALLKALATYQDTATGLWYQVIDHGSDAKNWLETSSSMMFTYALKRAVQQGFLDQSYSKYVNRGYNGILTQISKTGTNQVKLIDISEGTSVSADINYYYNRARNTNDYHGLGTFLIMNEYLAYNNLPYRSNIPLPALTVSPSSQNIPSTAGTATFTVTATISWTASSNQTWCTVTPSGSGNGTITATIAENAETYARTTTISIAGSGINSQTVTLIQAAGNTTAVENSKQNIAIYPCPIKDKLIISSSNKLVNADIAIYSLTGKKIYTSTITNNNYEIDMSKFTPGAYLVKIISPGKGIQMLKIIKQ